MRKRCAAFYIRLSDADEEVKKGFKDESNSISAQRDLLYAFVRNDAELAEFEVLEYFDDGLSGTGFEKRESFQQMIRDAKGGRFECILVKDFSRFGRDYLEVGNYLEFVFPLMGIRFISVNDGYDSNRSVGMTGGMDLAFKNLIYQLYSRDLSKKVKSARRNRNLNGEYTASFVAYGYRKDPADRHRLVIDEEEAGIIREIFEKTIAGMSGGEIARDLNARGVPTRLKRQWGKSRYAPVHDHGDYLWDSSEINAILRNEAYTGLLIQNKYEIKGFGDDKRLEKRNREDWSVIEGGIPAIVSRETFEKAKISCQPGRAASKKKRSVNLFECPYCGRKLRTTRYARKLVCRVRTMDEGRPCAGIMVPLEDAQRIVLDTVREVCGLAVDSDSIKTSRTQHDGRQIEKQVESLRQEKEKIERDAIGLYKEYRGGTITKEAYIAARAEGKKRLAELETALCKLSEQIQEKIESEDTEDYSYLRELEAFDADILSKVVSKVLVYDDKRVEVVFRCDDFIKKEWETSGDSAIIGKESLGVK